MKIEFARLSETDLSRDAAAVFVDGFYELLTLFSKDRERLIRAFTGNLLPDCFWLAIADGKPVGLAAVSDASRRAVRLNKGQLRRELGFLAGSFAYMVMKGEFSQTLTYPMSTGYIECVATARDMRGKGVATRLLRSMMDATPYTSYVLEVVDTNRSARRIYERLGFVIFERRKEKNARRKGFSERLYMRADQR